MSSKKSPLVRSEILRLFRNTMAADHMLYGHSWEKLQQKVKTLLSQKQRTFSGIFLAFSKPKQDCAHFENKHQLHSFNISEVIEAGKCGYFSARKLRF